MIFLGWEPPPPDQSKMADALGVQASRKGAPQLPFTPLANPPPLQSPPPTRETVTSMFFWLTCIVLVCVAHLVYTWPCIAFPLLRIKHLCVLCDILSPKALYGCVVLLLQTQDVFSR